mgnify:CR=1 FL=1|tara:strand:+ start:6545 stop:6976 length:432 start_codon:yes stop_codon:yes gene_type:complete
MLLIAHRGNINGPDPDNENTVEHVLKALESGYNVEVDVWKTDSGLYFGHDQPTNSLNMSDLQQYHNKIWYHCKDIKTLLYFTATNNIYFFHQNDDVTLTSNGFLWTYPEKQLTSKSICLKPENYNYIPTDCYGICSDYISKFV